MKLRALYELADLVARARGPEQIYETALNAIMTACEADRASVLVSDKQGVMRFKAWHGLSDAYRAAVEGHSPWEPEIGAPTPVLIPDVLRDPALEPFRDLLQSEGIHALAFIPLLFQGAFLGKLVVYYNRLHEFSETEVQAAGTVAIQVAYALDRARADEAISDLLERERAARRDAEQANRAKDEYLAMLAHELRNPLGAIVNGVGVLDRTGDRALASALARTLVRRQTHHLARLLDDLLDVARITRGRIDLRRQPLDLRTVASLAVEAHRHRIHGKRQDLAVVMRDRPVVVSGDLARLQQVTGNLLDNASKFTPSGGSISLVVAVEDGEAVLRVRDNGPGIPSDRLGSIFDPFAQVNVTLAHTEGGLGIGLTLVKQVVELHGGTVEARSARQDQGAEFVVRLPVSSEPLPAPMPVEPDARSWQIAVIEDNEDARQGLVMMLRLEGHEVCSASTGHDGVAMVLREQPELALVDIGLPDIDGYEVARRLRGQCGGSLKLVALSGYGQPEDRERSRDAGFEAHLVKPVAADDIIRLLS